MLLLAVSPCHPQVLPPMERVAKITTEDGTPLAVSPQIIFPPGDCRIREVFGGGTVVFIPTRLNPDRESFSAVCEVTIFAQGYRTMKTVLRDGAVILLKRLGENEGTGVSMTVLRAPPNAKKEYERGEQAIAKKKWAEAQARFEQALALYPDYATAWSQMSDALQHQGKLPEAETALNRAIKADPKYIKPYVQLASLLLDQKRWEDAAGVAEQAFKLNPIEFPQVYSYYALACLNLGRMDAAEKSARRAVDLDSGHDYPRAEYVLAAVLAGKGDLAGAIEHARQYVSAVRRREDTSDAKRQIADWERQAASARH